MKTASFPLTASNPKAPCSFIVYTWPLKGLPYYNFGVYVYTIKLLGASGQVLRDVPFAMFRTISDLVALPTRFASCCGYMRLERVRVFLSWPFLCE